MKCTLPITSRRWRLPHSYYNLRARSQAQGFGCPGLPQRNLEVTAELNRKAWP